MWTMWLACADPGVLVKGTVVDGPKPTDSPVPGAALVLRDDEGSVFDSDDGNANGAFRMLAPKGSNIFIDIKAAGMVETSFFGVSGLADVLQLNDGDVHTFSVASRDEWTALFAGCPGADDPSGAATLGEVRIFDLVDPVSGEPPLVIDATVRILDVFGEEVAIACYLNESGLAYEPASTVTGLSGRFAIFGLSQGFFVIEVSYPVATIYLESQSYPIWLNGGGVSPRFPLYISFAF